MDNGIDAVGEITTGVTGAGEAVKCDTTIGEMSEGATEDAEVVD